MRGCQADNCLHIDAWAQTTPGTGPNPSPDTYHDAPGNHESDPPIDVRGQANRRVIRWRGRENGAHDITDNPLRICPGDTIIIPTAHPGNCRAIGDLPDYGQTGAASLDIGDETNRQARGRPTLRISDELLQGWQRIVDRNDAPESDDVESMATPGNVLTALSEINQDELTSPERQDLIANLLGILSAAIAHGQIFVINDLDL